MESRESQLKPFSIGIVVEDKQTNSDYIKVTPIEHLTLVNGPLKDQKIDYHVKLPNAKGIVEESKLQGEVVLVAKWLPLGQTNRLTAPDVYKNEQVQIYRFADTDEYHWDTMFREPKLRKLESFTMGLSNISKKALEAFSKATSYWWGASTKDKKVYLHTSKNDGEFCEYDVEIDTKKGVLTIKDDLGNLITLDSSKSTVTVQGLQKVSCKDKSGSNHVTIDGSAGTVLVKAANTVTLEAPKVNVKGVLTVNDVVMEVP